MKRLLTMLLCFILIVGMAGDTTVLAAESIGYQNGDVEQEVYEDLYEGQPESTIPDKSPDETDIEDGYLTGPDDGFLTETEEMTDEPSEEEIHAEEPLNATPDYTITVDKTSIDFGKANVGYTEAPAAQNIVVTNAGDAQVTLNALDSISSRYDIELVSGNMTLDPGASATLSIRPKLDLSSEGHNIYISTEEGSEVAVWIEFMVGYYLEGTVNAASLDENVEYVMTGDTTINIAAGDDKHIKNIGHVYGEDGYNLTIQGSNAGKLTVEEDIYPSPSGSTKTLTITGGTIECGRYILAGGDITISGGNITTHTFRSYDGDITISDGKIRAEIQSGDYPIHADNVTITGGYVSAFGGTYSAIAATDDIEITGGVIDARNRENASYGLEAGGDLTIGGTAYIDAEGSLEAIRCFNSGELTIGSGLKITHPSDGVISEDKQHIYSSGFWPRQVHIEPASITYAISASSASVDFGSGGYGEEPPAAQEITITNSGTGPVELDEIDTSALTAFTVGEFSESYLIPGGTATFTVRPKAYLAAGTTFQETITVPAKRDYVAAIEITLKYVVQHFPYSISASLPSVEFGSVKEGIDPESKSVTLTNISSQPNGTLHFNDEHMEQYFGLENFTVELDGNQVTKGNYITATICPKKDLEPGIYEETLVIDTNEGAKVSIDLSFEVLAWDYTITADKTELDFGRASVGYVNIPKAQKVKITNAGEKPVTLKDPATYSPYYYNVSTNDSLTIQPGKSVTLSVRPKSGLTSGDGGFYVKTEQDSEVYISIKFDVGYYLSGDVKASSLFDGHIYYLVGNTTITIEPGDDKKLDSISHRYGTDGYNLTIKGSDAGKLTCQNDIYPSSSGSTKTLTIKGGTIECGRYILAGGNISVSGGNITVDTLSSYDGDLTISGGTINARQESNDPTIKGDNVTITGGKINAYGNSYPAVYSYNDMTITGGIIEAVNIGGSYRYGIYAMDNLTIGGTAYIDAKGGSEAIRGGTSLSVADTLQMKSGTDSNVHVGDDTSAHPGHLVNGIDDIVSQVTVGKNLNAGNATFNSLNFDFGNMTLGGKVPAAQIVVIENTGSTPLIIENIIASGDKYEIGDFSAFMINVGEKASFTIRPDETKILSDGSFTGEINIKLSDSDEPRKITTKLMVYPAIRAMYADTPVLDFGTVPLGYTGTLETKTAKVSNTGNIAFNINEPVVTGTAFVLGDISTLELAYGGYAEVPVTVADGVAETSGVYTETISFTGEHGANASVQVKLEIKDVGEDIWIAEIPDQDYTGKPIKPALNVYYKGRKLGSKDYNASYKNNINAATKDATKTVKGKVVSAAPTVTVTGIGNFKGTAAKTFTIEPLDISEAKADDIILAHTGSVQQGKTKITYRLGGKWVTLKENKDYTYDYLTAGLKDPGSYTIAIRGKGNYKEAKELLEKIIEPTEQLLSEVKIPKIPDQKYTGASFILAGVPGEGENRALNKSGKGTFDFVIKNSKNKTLTYGTDYNLTYTENKEIGTATVTVIGDGIYVGRRIVTFKITGTSLKKLKTEGFVSSMGYTGTERKQPMKFYYKSGKGKSAKKHYLIDGVDYEASYVNNIEVGTATVTYTGKGAYTGKVKKTYKITGVSMKKVTVPKDFKATTGSYGEGYYSDRYNASTKSFAFMGNPFKVAGPEDGTQDYGIKLKYIHDGIAEDMVKGTDYTVSYAKNVNPGKATVIFTGTGRFKGKVKSNFTISPFDISKEHMDNYIANTARYRKGGARITTVNLQYRQYPHGWVKLQEGVDFTVKYKYNDAITNESTTKKPTITVTGKGNFKGSFTEEFQIVGGSLQYDTVLTASDVVAKNKAGICKPVITLNDSSTGAKLKAGTDYDVNYAYTYRDNTTVKDADTGADVNRAAGDPVGDKDVIPVKTRIKVEVTGKGNYQGTTQHGYFSFIYPSNANISKANVSIKPQTYTGDTVTIDSGTEITVKFGKKGTPLVYGTDYRIVDGSYRNNINKGTAKVTIEAIPGSGYTGRKTVTFKITAKPLSAD